MEINKASLLRVVMMTTALVISYALLLNFPQPLFPHSVKAANLVLHSERGNPVPGERTLDYFLAHSFTGQFLGPVRFVRLPQWVAKGTPTV